jgi:hypothetical protein
MPITAAQSLALTPGKHNMASEAFQELKLARAEGRAPKGEELSFGDIVDTLNPLQHLPLVGQAYRALTGDSISATAKVTGAAIYGGPFGAVASIATEAVSADQTARTKQASPALALQLPGDSKNAAPDVAAKTAAFSPAGDTLMTGSLAVPAAKPAPAAQAASGQPSSGPLPKLSAEAFDALIRSFPAGAVSAGTASANAISSPTIGNAALPSAAPTGMPLSLLPPAPSPKAPDMPQPDLAAIMQETMDKYTELRSEKDEDDQTSTN